MPLDDGYGVLRGPITDYFRDDPDDYGKYYHGNLRVQAPNGEYRCAIDVDAKSSAVGVEWRVVELRADELASVLSLGVGYHDLATSSSSGALDYIRSPMFAARTGCVAIIMGLLGKKLDVSTLWKKGSDIDALSDLEPLVQSTRNAGLHALVFGEPFSSGLGLHNIHQNQGDPAGSIWYQSNGTWQDGCTVLQQSADTWVAFMNKFSTQSYATDDFGHPI
ncbi:MAG: DUF2278 family protein [Myxococcales bacterium]|nr:DUF2278 family protein [Myxococcales bacterium]